MKDCYKVGIIGYTGMVGQELIRIFETGAYGVLDIEKVKVEIAYKRNSSEEIGRLEDCEVVFLATKDQASLDCVQEVLDAGCRVIDMSGAFRLDKERFEAWYGIEHTKPELFEKAVYGMPAIFRDKIKDAVLVANPGCYATSVILALYPLSGFLEGEATVVSTSGNSGARKSVEDVSDEWAYSYGHRHKHVPEMMMYTGMDVNFTPVVLRSVFKGINTNIRVKLSEAVRSLPFDEQWDLLENALKYAYPVGSGLKIAFHWASSCVCSTKVVNDTNNICVKVNIEDGYAYINSCIDNLGKGAAAQAVENFKIMCGIE